MTSNAYQNQLSQLSPFNQLSPRSMAERDYHDRRMREAQMMSNAGPQPDFLGNPAPKKAEPNKVLLLLEN